jgi:hypothetical protein
VEKSQPLSILTVLAKRIIQGKDTLMSTMQAFYDKLQSDDRQNDAQWQQIKQVVNAPLDQVTQFSDELGWYFWTALPEVKA